MLMQSIFHNMISPEYGQPYTYMYKFEHNIGNIMYIKQIG